MKLFKIFVLLSFSLLSFADALKTEDLKGKTTDQVDPEGLQLPKGTEDSALSKKQLKQLNTNLEKIQKNQKETKEFLKELDKEM